MNQKEIFDKVSFKASRMTTLAYSTSFSLGIKLLYRKIQDPIFSIYGFVRYADEIVDTFHEYDKATLLEEFWQQTYEAIDRGISMNPILNSFQLTVNRYNIERELIDTFLRSMEMDLDQDTHSRGSYDEYIVGSAEVVGLMCLRVFTDGDNQQYEKLKPSAMKLGAAFQKINFLRDLKADYQDLGRMYFPNLDMSEFSEETKKKIEDEIADDFKAGYEGIKQLPKKARIGVYLAYVYYLSLFKKIKKTPSSKVMEERIRVPNTRKYFLLAGSYVKHQLDII